MLAVKVLATSVWHLPQVDATLNFGDGRLGVAGGENLVDSVAIGADGGLLRAVGDGAAVDARLIGEEGLRGFAVRLHEELLPVAAAAGGGNVGVIDGRFGIVAGDDLMDVAVAVLAACGDFAVAYGLGVNAVRVALACASAWHWAQVIFFGGVSCARLLTSLWQSTHLNMEP